VYWQGRGGRNGNVNNTKTPLQIPLCRMGCFRRAGHPEYRVSPPEWVGHGFLGEGIGDPLAVHHQAVFIGAGLQDCLLQPATARRGMHGLGFRIPVVERARDTNNSGSGMNEFEANRFRLRFGGLGVVMVFVVFHSGESNALLRHKSFPEHFCHDENDESSEQASTSQEIYQGVTDGGKHGLYYHCNHRSMNG